jgi:hypothetical protein
MYLCGILVNINLLSSDYAATLIFRVVVKVTATNTIMEMGSAISMGSTLGQGCEGINTSRPNKALQMPKALASLACRKIRQNKLVANPLLILHITAFEFALLQYKAEK